MKRRVIDQTNIGDKVCLFLDKPTATKASEDFRKVRIDNIEYDPLPISHNIDGKMIAFVAEGNFIGKEVEFI